MRLAGIAGRCCNVSDKQKKVCGLLVHVIGGGGGRLYIKKHDRHSLRLFPQSCGGDPIKRNGRIIKNEIWPCFGWVLRVVAGSCNIYVSCSNARGLKNC